MLLLASISRQRLARRSVGSSAGVGQWECKFLVTEKWDLKGVWSILDEDGEADAKLGA